MGTGIFLTCAAAEAALAAYCIITKSNNLRLKRIVRIGYFAVFLMLILTPLIEWSGKYYTLGTLLLIMASSGAVAMLTGKPEKRPYKTAVVVRKAIGITVVLFIATLPAMLFPKHRDIAPTGEYVVATAKYSYTDENRLETYNDKGEKRRLNVEFWYPQNGEGTFPLVVFSHGSFGVKSSNESLYRELASRGYVVCSIDHTYQCFFTKNEDGKTIFMNMDYAKEILDENPKKDPQRSFKDYEEWMKIRTDDINFVIDYILAKAKGNESEDEKDKVYHLVDSSKIGVMGHSLGGSAVLAIGRMRKDVKAVIELEAPYMYDIKGVKDGSFVYEKEVYPVPVLNVYSDASYSHLSEWMQYKENYDMLSSGNPNTFNVYMKGAGHLTLTDFPLTSPPLAQVFNTMMGAKSTRDSKECIVIINRISVEFFDCYLKGTGKFTRDGEY